MISLRQAKIDDFWRKSYLRNYPLLLNEIGFENGEIFDGLKLSLEPGINAIVGRNGIGKSNFIRSVFNSLASESSNRKKFNHLLDGCDVTLDVSIDAETYSLTCSPYQQNTEDSIFLCLLFDPCNLIPEIQKLFCEQGNIEELLESYNSVELDSDDLKLVNFLTNSTYQKVEIINIEDEYEGFPMVPFFIVEQDGARYDSRNMGLGELSLLYFFWLIDYIKKSDSHCLLLIEEPESFLPPLTQNRLCNVVAMTCAEKGTYCLISTHSEHILKRIPRTHIHAMSKVSGEVKFFTVSSHFEQMGVLGLTSPKKGVLFFEDEAAGLLIKALVKASLVLVVDSFYYHNSVSDNGVINDLERFPNGLAGFSFIAIFDGDCRGKYDRVLRPHSNYMFLPSNESPEGLLIDYLASEELSLVSACLRVSREALSAAFAEVAGSDHHDYFHELARALSIPFDTVFSSVCELWISSPGNSELVESFLDELERCVG